MIKNVFIFVLMFCFCCHCAKGESPNQLDSLIRKSLISYFEIQKQILSERVLAEVDFYLCIDHFPPGFKFEDTIVGFKMHQISFQGKNYLYREKQLRKGIGVTELKEMSLKGNKLTIHFSDKNVKLIKKSHFLISYYAGASYEYEFNCENQSWSLMKTKFYGNLIH